MIKVGSNVLYDHDTGIDVNTMKNIVESIQQILENETQVFLVSSGAVAVWKKILNNNGLSFWECLTSDQQALCASVWQTKLIETYARLFEDKHIVTSQILLTHNDFEQGENLQNLLKVLTQVQGNMVPIINENDTISREELKNKKFSDNDELAGLVAVNIKAKRLIILSNIDGFYKNFWTSEAQIIESINENNIEQYKQYITEDKSSFGRWGGGSKIGLFETVMKQGIWGVLANGKEPWIIQKVFFHDQPCKKTLFIPKQ